MAASERIFDVLDDNTIINNKTNLKSVSRLNGDVEFKLGVLSDGTALLPILCWPGAI